MDPILEEQMEDKAYLELGREVAALESEIMIRRRLGEHVPRHLDFQVSELKQRLDAIIEAKRNQS